MTLKQHQFTALGLVLVLAAILAPSASAQPIDQVGPGSLPASSSGESATAPRQVLPNPDNQQPASGSAAVDSSTASTLPHGVQYSSTQATTRSSEPALRRNGSEAVPFVADVQPSAPATASGFDWGDAGIGAGAAFALTMIGIGGMLVLSNRRHRDARPATTA